MLTMSLFHLPGSWTDETLSLFAVLLILILNTATDLAAKRISLPITAVAAVFGFVQSIAVKRSPADFFPALLPGLFLISFSFLAKGGIGGGDGIIVMALGFFLPALTIFSLCALSFSAAALYAGFLLFRGHRGSESMPFLPFILLSFVILQLFDIFRH